MKELPTVNSSVATLTIRNLPEEVRERLRLRAARRGRSMEAEVRAILMAATAEEERATPAISLQAWVDELYGAAKPKDVVDALLAERRREADAE